MSSLTIEAPALKGLTVMITGTKCGPFLIHQDEMFRLFNEKLYWSVSHIKTGMRFPYSFATKKEATAFAKEAMPVMDWEAVQAEPGEGVKSNWIAGGPTAQQRKAIRQLAEKHAVAA